MAKIFILSFDDGTIYDRRFTEILNRYGIPGTFNLNSGLENFVWYYEDRFPICRQRLKDTLEQYRGHEIASHSLHHHWLNTLTPAQLRREVEEDCDALKALFGLEEIGFGVPFTACGEREIRILKKFVRYIRLSEEREHFALPPDPWHIPIHGLFSAPDIRDRILRFSQSQEENALFVMAGHSYECQTENRWEYLEDLLAYLKTFDFQFMTTMDFVNTYYPR